jgi:flagellar hook assembly protein FlgD
VTIEVFDVSGRLVARLLDERREAGRHRVEWRGEDARGSAAPSGVYFCRMRAGSYEATRKIVLMR